MYIHHWVGATTHPTNNSFFFLGKSSLVIQFCENHFVDSYYPTIENTFTKTIKYRGNGKVMESGMDNARCDALT
jgi:GTPase SAR1 family protein